MSAEKMRKVQLQMRQNQMEIGNFLTDLDSWTNDIKKEDENLKKMKPSEKRATSYPPVRSATVATKIKEKRTQKETSKVERIKSHDYRTWEKLDCDKMMDDIDREEEEADKEVEVELDKLNTERKAKVAAEMKEKGNEHFKNCGYEAAIECYTTGLEADPSNPVFPANRAMAYLKLKKYFETEADCTLALSLDPTYTKAYLRRGIARAELGKVSSANKDFKDALKLEPGNRQAKAELGKLNKKDEGSVNHNDKTNTSVQYEKSKYVRPIYFPPENRSKKPLMRINIQELGIDESERKDTNIDVDVVKKMTEDTNGLGNERQTQRPAISILSEEINTCEGVKHTVAQTQITNAYSNSTRSQEAKTNGKNKHVPVENSTTHSPKLSRVVSSIPSCPATSFQFQADVKRLSMNAAVLLSYLYQIKPTQISTLLKQQIETSTLMPVLWALGYNPEKNEIDLDYLHAFANLDRFDMIVMFLSGEEMKDIRKMFENLTRKFPARNEDIRLLSKKYGL